MRRQLARIAACIATALLPGIAPAQVDQPFDPGVARPTPGAAHYAGADKAVYHVTTDADERGYLALLGNVRNHLNAWRDAGVKGQLKVVMNGDGLNLLKLAKEREFEATSRLAGAVGELRERGVQFQICYNTLAGYRIALADLYEARAEDVVLSGVAEVAVLQAQGYRLVKP